MKIYNISFWENKFEKKYVLFQIKIMKNICIYYKY